MSKLTMGRPGRSLTAVGVGKLGLRSFRFMLVAARISSLLISNEVVDFGVSTSCMGSIAAVGGGVLEVYSALFD